MTYVIKKLLQNSIAGTNLRTAVFTSGHFFIDFFVITLVTGATIGQATLASFIAPLINGVWYWLLDRLWSTSNAV
jgi:uncharacterized membrane protein